MWIHTSCTVGLSGNDRQNAITQREFYTRYFDITTKSVVWKLIYQNVLTVALWQKWQQWQIDCLRLPVLNTVWRDNTAKLCIISIANLFSFRMYELNTLSSNYTQNATIYPCHSKLSWDEVLRHHNKLSCLKVYLSKCTESSSLISF